MTNQLLVVHSSGPTHSTNITGDHYLSPATPRHRRGEEKAGRRKRERREREREKEKRGNRERRESHDARLQIRLPATTSPWSVEIERGTRPSFFFLYRAYISRGVRVLQLSRRRTQCDKFSSTVYLLGALYIFRSFAHRCFERTKCALNENTHF